MKKILIIRFSSIGDIIQCMSIISGIKAKYPKAEIHWVTRRDMSSILRVDNRINNVWEFERRKGFIGLIQLGFELRRQKFTHIYDAHNNIRSTVLKAILTTFGLRSILGLTKTITRSKDRLKRILLFRLGINLFPKPNKSFDSYCLPLKRWKITMGNMIINHHFMPDIESRCKLIIQPITSQDKPWITIVPSAAWPLKRWDTDYWKQLVEDMPDYNFVILAGHKDRFCEKIQDVAPERVLNLAGNTSILDSLCIVTLSKLIISGDTGFLHAADIFGINAIALIGPTAFGFPSGKNTTTMEIDLPCRPCSKDGNTKCKNSIEKQCLRDITAEMVASKAREKYVELK